MHTFLLTHAHDPKDCPIAFAAWKGFASPLRHAPTLASCLHGGHRLWWTVKADDADAARAMLPPWLAARTEVSAVGHVQIP